MIPLAEKILRIDSALADVPHAFGGAIALAYWAEPRTTIDIDVNVFVGPEHSAEVLGPLASVGADITGAEATIVRDGQVRIWWDRTPVDVFFAYDPFHDAAGRAAVEVPFADTTMRVLTADHLAVCKAVFDRPKDWIDIQAMLDLGTHLDTAEVLRWLGRIVGDEDQRYERMAALLSSG